MHIHDYPEDRRIGDLQIRRSFIVTLAGFWTTVLLLVWSFTPLSAPGVWPLLETIEISRGRKAPSIEGDVFVSVTGTGELYLDHRKATFLEIVRKCSVAAQPLRGWRVNPYANEVFIRVDKAAPFGAVREVIKAAQAAGVERVTFLARPSGRYTSHDALLARTAQPPSVSPIEPLTIAASTTPPPAPSACPSKGASAIARR